MKRLIWTVLVGLLIAGFESAPVVSQQPDPLKRIMHRKLDHSQRILEALVFENFEAVEKSSGELDRLTTASNWNVTRSHEYSRHSSEFRLAITHLSEASINRNLENAALAYGELTLSCVRCHQHVRGVQRAAVP
jgi:vancomycin resistance protein YoaR